MTNERRQELEERALIVAQEWQQAGLVQSGKYLVPNIADMLSSVEREVWLKAFEKIKQIDQSGKEAVFKFHDIFMWIKEQQTEVGNDCQ